MPSSVVLTSSALSLALFIYLAPHISGLLCGSIIATCALLVGTYEFSTIACTVCNSPIINNIIIISGSCSDTLGNIIIVSIGI